MATWTHCPTWPGHRQDIDRVIFRDGVRVARAYRYERGPQAGNWGWFGEWKGKDAQHVGTAASLEEALSDIMERVERMAGASEGQGEGAGRRRDSSLP